MAKEDLKDIVNEELLKDKEENQNNEDDGINYIDDNKVDETVEKQPEEIDYKAKYLEAIAAMDNLRKRQIQEQAHYHKYRAQSFLENILPTVDMFEMALNAKDVSDEVKNWLTGFEMIHRNLVAAMESEGVKEIKVNIGDTFDSDKHIAIEAKENDEFKPNSIIEIKTKGYMLHDRLLRPTQVIVAKQIKKEGN